MNELSPTQLAYLAGILDGEGEFSICLYARKDSRKRIRSYGLKAQVRIAQARRSLLDSIADDVGYEHVNIGKAGKGGKYFYLRFRHSYLLHLIPLLTPYIRLKTEQAQIVTEFLHMPSHVGRTGVGEAEWQRRMELRDRCCHLNTTPQALDRHAENGTVPRYMIKMANTPFISNSTKNIKRRNH